MLLIEMEKNKIFRRPYRNYALFRDFQSGFTGGHIKTMLFIEITQIELTGSHIEIMQFIKIEKKNFPAAILK